MIAIACTGAFASCASPSPKTARIPVSTTSSKQDPSLTGQLLQEVNSYRRNHGARELQRHAGLDRLAQKHCEFLRQNRGKFGIRGQANVSHMGFDGRALMARQNYNMLTCAENVASTSDTSHGIAPTLVKIWTNSKSHQKNMVDDWTHTGIGIVKDSDGTVFSTQLFGTISYSQMTSRNRFNGY
ncbi:CAP domain-containing protein [Luteolibacter yonseiensis]|uniref:CAP domain-containing protein n=1 Tax=Luteolibacter yonseiensis TaxID=1144680 RepID=A0A934R9T4_9BACT|nr:CAP domain-containing protein [Luteolibacter yonseiensis]MBK1817795.1 CAP domain-containing protein [Luteolibacter yonseiensis]